jgi:hypothetical protein
MDRKNKVAVVETKLAVTGVKELLLSLSGATSAILNLNFTGQHFTSTTNDLPQENSMLVFYL